MFDFIPSWLLKPLLDLVQKWGWLSAKVNASAINAAASVAPHRPYAFSTYSDYTCWTSLTDQRYSARHLPPVHSVGLPASSVVAKLFEQPATGQIFCPKSTCLFPAFAQYLTDGFIRTRMPHAEEKETLRRQNTSNHQIDMCALYGRTPGQTKLLRRFSEVKGERGRLKTQSIDGEEYSPFLYEADGITLKKEFQATDAADALDPPLSIGRLDSDPDGRAKRAALFAAGGDRVNAAPQIAMVNTLFLREHNRIAGELDRLHANDKDWNDDRVFEIARNIVIVLFIKIVVEEYITHIAPLPFRFRADPTVAWEAPWNKPNWITTEFSLLYRWHSLVPDTLTWGGTPYAVGSTILDMRPLIATGLRRAFVDMSAQPAGKLGPFNTAPALVGVEALALDQGRLCDVAPYVKYKEYISRKAPRSFEEISSNPKVVAFLKSTYKSVDKVEFYAGLFAEDTVANSPLPGLMLAMVAVDAFSQALTNPLLSKQAYNELTFTPYGWQLIQETGSLRDILARNMPGGIGDARISMTRADWRYR